MHEYSIIASLIGRVEREASAHEGARVLRLHVSIGELAGVEIDFLSVAFETFRDRTVCQDAELTIRTVESVWSCPTCKRELERGAILRCATCGSPAQLTRGDEIILERIEMEAPYV